MNSESELLVAKQEHGHTGTVPGAIVFRLELPLALALTMNAYSAKKGRKWAMDKHNKRVDAAIDEALSRWPRAVQRDLRRWVEPQRYADGRVKKTPKGKIRMHHRVSGGRRRRVKLVRYSSSKPDEAEHGSVDTLGGKCPVDRMVLKNILRADDEDWLEREAHWEPAPPKNGRVVVEVFDIGGER